MSCTPCDPRPRVLQVMGLAVELLNSSPADDVETRYRCSFAFQQVLRTWTAD